jgi:integrase/recombinase XerD
MTSLRKRMIEDMQLRNLAPETQRGYLHHVAGLAQFYQTSPEHLNLEDIRPVSSLPGQRMPVLGAVGEPVCFRCQVPL